MGAARHIGRVGSLAVALGIGAAVATGQGIAGAEPGEGSSSEASASESSPAPDTPPGGTDESAPEDSSEPDETDVDEPEPDAGDDLDDALDDEDEGGLDGDLDEDDAEEPVDDEPVDRDPSDSDSDERPVTKAFTVVAEPAEADDSAATEDALADTPAQLDADESVLETATAATEPEVTVTALTTATVSAAATNPVRALMALPGTFLRAASNLIAAALTPLIGTVPAAPTQPPTLWAVLAWVRREIQHTFFNTRPRVEYDAALNEQGVTGVVTGDLNISDREDDPVTVTIVDGPQGGTVEINPDGTFRYVPSEALAQAGGTDQFVIRVSDGGFHFHGLRGLFGGGHSTTATIEVTVAAVNEPPDEGEVVDVVTDPATGAVTGRVVVDDPDGDALTYSGPTTSTHGGVVEVAADGTFTYTPTDEIRHAAAANTDPVTTDTFTVIADDGRGGRTEVQVSVPIVGQNTAPDYEIEVSQSASYASFIRIHVGDSDGDTVRITVSNPQYGTITGLPADGVITVDGTGTVTLQYQPSTTNPRAETLTFVIDDGHQGGQVTVPVAVGHNAAPVITAVTTESVDPTTGAVTVRITVTNDDGAVTYTFTAPAHGEITFEGDGQFVYTPDLDYFTGKPAGTTDTFVVTVTDPGGRTTTRSLTYTWAPVNTGLLQTDDVGQALTTSIVGGWSISRDGTVLYLSDGEPYFSPAGLWLQDIRVFRIGVDAAGNRTYTEQERIRVTGIMPRHRLSWNLIGLSADGTRLYVQLIVEDGDESSRLISIDTATGQIDSSVSVPLQYLFTDMAVAPDGSAIYGVGADDWLYRVDLATNEVSSLGVRAARLALDADAGLLYGVYNSGTDISVIDLESGTVSTRYAADRQITIWAPLAVSPDGSRLYLTDRHQLYVLDAATGQTVERYAIADSEAVVNLLVTADGTVFAVERYGHTRVFTPILGPGGTITA
ncbi:Ig-like domain-containing protein [Mycolicibacterium phlei]|jgi:VCBS repeat-containing protein